MTKSFDEMTENEQDEVARARMKEILAKPKLEEGDAATVAACVAFIGTSQKMADKFSQALLDTAESLIQGICVRCGEDPGEGPEDCFICSGIRNVKAKKLEEPEAHVEPLEEIEDMEVAAEIPPEPIVRLSTKPWTPKELEALKVNRHLQPPALAKYVGGLRHRTQLEIEAKLKELKEAEG